MIRRSDLAGDQIFRHGDEIVVSTLAIGFSGRIVPLRAEFAAAADIGEDVNPSSFQPGRSDAGAVTRQQGDFKAAIAIEQRGARAVEFQPFPADPEVGNSRAILRCCLVLADGQSVGVEERWQALDLLAVGLAERPVIKAGGSQKVRDGHEIGIGSMPVHAAQSHRAEVGCFNGRASPFAVFTFQHEQLVSDVLQLIEHKEILCLSPRRQGFAVGRLEQYVKDALPFHISGERSSQKRSGGVGLALEVPIGSQLEQELIFKRADLRVIRLLDSGPIDALPKINVAGEERLSAMDEFIGPPVIVNHARPHAHILRLPLEHKLGFRHGSVPLPLLDDARVTRGRQRVRTEIRADVKRITIPPGNVALRFRQKEPAGHKFLRGEVELSDHGSVRPAA